MVVFYSGCGEGLLVLGERDTGAGSAVSVTI